MGKNPLLVNSEEAFQRVKALRVGKSKHIPGTCPRLSPESATRLIAKFRELDQFHASSMERGAIRVFR
jgi:hypothetical protein